MLEGDDAPVVGLLQVRPQLGVVGSAGVEQPAERAGAGAEDAVQEQQRPALGEGSPVGVGQRDPLLESVLGSEPGRQAGAGDLLPLRVRARRQLAAQRADRELEQGQDSGRLRRRCGPGRRVGRCRARVGFSIRCGRRRRRRRPEAFRRDTEGQVGRACRFSDRRWRRGGLREVPPQHPCSVTRQQHRLAVSRAHSHDDTAVHTRRGGGRDREAGLRSQARVGKGPLQVASATVAPRRAGNVPHLDSFESAQSVDGRSDFDRAGHARSPQPDPLVNRDRLIATVQRHRHIALPPPDHWGRCQTSFAVSRDAAAVMRSGVGGHDREGRQPSGPGSSRRP